MTSLAVLGLPGIGSGGHGCGAWCTDEPSGSQGKLNAKLSLDRCSCVKQSKANTDKCCRQWLIRREAGKGAEETEEGSMLVGMTPGISPVSRLGWDLGNWCLRETRSCLKTSLARPWHLQLPYPVPVGMLWLSRQQAKLFGQKRGEVHVLL